MDRKPLIWAEGKSRTKPRRQPLSRDRVLAAALRLVDKAGVVWLSMGDSGTLGVEAMSRYTHVASKDDVPNGLVDLVVAEIDRPPGASSAVGTTPSSPPDWR